jgi:hypothetical protein
MIYQEAIDFKYKGNRNYVQGPDIYDAMLQKVLEVFAAYPIHVKGAFNHLLKNNGILRIHESTEEIDKNNLCAFFSITIGSDQYYVVLLDAGTKISSSYSYDEEKVLESMMFYSETVKMRVKSEFTYIEQMIAMTKKLHLLIYPEAKGKWLFTKIDLGTYIDPQLYQDQNISVKAKKNFHNSLTQNSVFVNAEEIGEIWFSMVKE